MSFWAITERPDYPWNFHRKMALRLADALSKARLHKMALGILKPLEAREPSNANVLLGVSRAYGRSGDSKTSIDYRAKVLRGRASRAAAARGTERPIQNLLKALANLEMVERAAPLSATRRFNELMSTDTGLEHLRAASESVIREFPESATVLYARAVSLAKGDAIAEAIALVTDAMHNITDAPETNKVFERARRLRLDRIREIWRVVDGIARDNMSWGAIEADGDGAVTESDAAEPATQPDDAAADSESTGAAQALIKPRKRRKTAASFDEALLQGRQQSAYLASCKRRFEDGKNLLEKLKAIKAMLRQGLRRMPSYHDAYVEATASLKLLAVEWRPLLVPEGRVNPTFFGKDGGLKSVRTLAQVLQLSRQLGLTADVKLIQKNLLLYAAARPARTAMWAVCSVLVESDPEAFTAPTIKLVTAPGSAPSKQHEIRDLLAWAARARRHDLAHKLYDSLSEKDRRSYALVHYVKILQREGKFEQALKLVETLNAAILCDGKGFSPFRSWSMIRRAGELGFLVDTAKWYGSAKQPAKPKGVVMIMPRNAGQLRKYPLVVLMELKKQGWAVIPLVEGVLPAEPTGDPQIDRFIGCMLQDNRLNPAITSYFKPVSGMKADIPAGKFVWNDIDLSHPLFEEAAINRRRFSVDFTCPSLGEFLGRLVDWTRLNATVIDNARRVLRAKKLRTGIMVLNQYRLPDAVNRFYCEQKGDPRDFFCIHTANGYENYFANFSRPVSTKAVIRNMTAHPELRTASFPVPDQFRAWYEARSGTGAEMLERVRDITKVKRSTGNATSRSAAAEACLKKIRDWRADGGKVACAFGKVVCDLGVPHDGGPAHTSLKDWLNHTIESVRGSRTLLLIKPHPHEKRNEIGTFLTEYLTDLIDVDVPDNVVLVGHDWFDIHDLNGIVDLGLLYNGTTAVELGLLGIPAVVCSDYAPIDYPIGHAVPRNRAHYRRLVRFVETVKVADDLSERAAGWIHYLSGDILTIPYRYHSRQITNKVIFPPRWFNEDIQGYIKKGDGNVRRLARRVTQVPSVAKPMKPLARATPVRAATATIPQAKPTRRRAASTSTRRAKAAAVQS